MTKAEEQRSENAFFFLLRNDEADENELFLDEPLFEAFLVRAFTLKNALIENQLNIIKD